MKINKIYPVYLFVFSLFAISFPGCSTVPRGGVKAGFDFSKIKTIGIGRFTPSSYNPSSGEVVGAEFAKQFLQKGYSVKYSRENVDVLLEGSIIEYSPSKKYLFTMNDTASNQIVINQQQPVEVSGTNAYSLGYVMGMSDKSKIVVSNSTIGISARFVDAVTNEVVWTNSYTYEGLDINSAIETTVDYLIRSIAGR